MPSYNKVILIGHCTRDPELRFLPNSTAVCECGIAVNEKRKDKSGNAIEDAMFIDFAVFGKPGEAFSQYMAKGRPVLVEGKLRLEQWTAQDGTKRSRHKLVVESWTFVGGGRQQQAPAERSAPRGRPGPQQQDQPPADDGVPF